MKTIYVVTINHRHGRDIFIAPTMSDVTKALYGYVDENWSDNPSLKIPIPKKKYEAVSAYFADPEFETYDVVSVDATAIYERWFRGNR